MSFVSDRLPGIGVWWICGRGGDAVVGDAVVGDAVVGDGFSAVGDAVVGEVCACGVCALWSICRKILTFPTKKLAFFDEAVEFLERHETFHIFEKFRN